MQSLGKLLQRGKKGARCMVPRLQAATTQRSLLARNGQCAYYIIYQALKILCLRSNGSFSLLPLPHRSPKCRGTRSVYSMGHFHTALLDAAGQYKGVVRELLALKGLAKHFLLQGPAAQAHIRLVQSICSQTKVGNGCILVFHCGLMSQCFGTWCLWE